MKNRCNAVRKNNFTAHGLTDPTVTSIPLPFRSTTRPLAPRGASGCSIPYHPSSCKRASASSAAGWPDCTAATRHRLASVSSLGHVRPLCSRCARPHCASASPSSEAWTYWSHARGKSPLQGVHGLCADAVQCACSTWAHAQALARAHARAHAKRSRRGDKG